MATYLKRGASAVDTEASATEVRDTVTEILARIGNEGDAAVRHYSETFDKFSPDNFRLSDAEIQACVNSLDPQTVEDIKFAQKQIRTFAEAQKAALLDIEIETIPGVRLGHKNIAIENVGCYVPGWRYPMVASAHMSVLTARIAGCKRVIACTPPTKGAAHPTTIAAMHFAGAEEIYLLGGV